MNLSHRLFPHAKLQNIKLFYGMSFLSEFYFIVGNWIFFWLHFMKYGEIGLLDSFAFLFGFLMEVPTGAIADSIGRKKTITLAFLFTFIGFMTIALANGHTMLIIGFLIAQTGWAFYSGAAEALAYDTLKEHNEEKDFDAVISTSQMLGLIALIIGALLGGALYSFNFRLPHMLTSLSFGVGFIVALFLHEPTIDSETFSTKKYLNQIKKGFEQLLLPSIKPFIPLILVTAGVGFMYGTGIIQPAIATGFGYNSFTISVLGAVGLAIAAIAVRCVPWMRTHLNDTQGLQILAILYFIGFILVTMPLHWILAGVVMVILSSLRPLTGSWTSVVVNRELPSEYRATTLSAIEMVKKIPYILVGGIAGSLIDNHMLSQLCLAISGVIGAIFILHWYFVKK